MLFVLLGCSLGRFEYDTCTSNAECRSAFGWGQVCGEEGLCEEAEAPTRCAQTWPEDLLTNRSEYADNIVLGVNYDGVVDAALREQEAALSIAFPTLAEDPAARYGVARPEVLPTTLVIDPQGRLHRVLVGPQTQESLRAATTSGQEQG